jgi:hypothetical protein
MTSAQFNTALRRLDLTQAGAARLLGVDGRTTRYWAAGDRAIPESIAILLRLLVAGKITIQDIEEHRK